ncbi:hypothetical protein B0H11DRAFT_1908882 [Mycena galericulata]|nr:hypothetical protein B0H11DRAFT_1908882 [Mycena galericulata]
MSRSPGVPFIVVVSLDNVWRRGRKRQMAVVQPARRSVPEKPAARTAPDVVEKIADKLGVQDRWIRKNGRKNGCRSSFRSDVAGGRRFDESLLDWCGIETILQRIELLQDGRQGERLRRLKFGGVRRVQTSILEEKFHLFELN